MHIRSILPMSLFFILLLSGCEPPDTAPDEEVPHEIYAEFNRSEAAGQQAAVVSGHPLATSAGQRVLTEGGNAVDAAVTMAAVLTVVRPHMNGVGGDAFGLFYDGQDGSITALNGSGRSGELATREFFRKAGHDEVPVSGPKAVTVPGAVSAWAEALERHGTIGLDEALQPAIRYAGEGFPVTPTLTDDLSGASEDLNEAGQEIFRRDDGEAYRSGDILRNPALAETFRTLAREGPAALYGGAIGEQIADFIEQEGGYLRAGDFQRHRADWVEPLQHSFMDKTIYAFPPNTQGVALPMQAAMAEQAEVHGLAHNSDEYLHHLIEIKKLAFADRDRWIADPAFEHLPVGRLLDPDYLADRAGQVSDMAAEQVTHGFGEELAHTNRDGDGDTVYLMVIDEQGNGVSWIQSLFHSFGSGLVEPETGLVLQNRGGGFTLQDGHPNRVAPDKRPFHTLSSSLITDGNGELALTIGTPGGDGQTQFKTQVLHNLFHFNMHPQQAVEAPRFRSYGGTSVAIEARVAPETRQALERRGHELNVIEGWTSTFGGMQLILHDPQTGILRTAADPRREAHAIAW